MENMELFCHASAMRRQVIGLDNAFEHEKEELASDLRNAYYKDTVVSASWSWDQGANGSKGLSLTGFLRTKAEAKRLGFLGARAQAWSVEEKFSPQTDLDNYVMEITLV